MDVLAFVYHAAMKSLLILILISTCIVAWRSDDVVDLIQGVSTVESTVGSGVTIHTLNQQGKQHIAYQSNPVSLQKVQQSVSTSTPMTMEKFVELSRSDSNAARKFFDRRAQGEHLEEKR